MWILAIEINTTEVWNTFATMRGDLAGKISVDNCIWHERCSSLSRCYENMATTKLKNPITIFILLTELLACIHTLTSSTMSLSGYTFGAESEHQKSCTKKHQINWINVGCWTIITI